MRQTLTLATACINTTPLDLDGNLSLIRQAVEKAAAGGADLLLLPELCLTGYGCEDMFFVSDWLDSLPAELGRLAASLPAQLLVAVGFPLHIRGGQVFNAVALLSCDGVQGIVCKQYWRVMVFTMNLAGLLPGQQGMSRNWNSMAVRCR